MKAPLRVAVAVEVGISTAPNLHPKLSRLSVPVFALHLVLRADRHGGFGEPNRFAMWVDLQGILSWRHLSALPHPNCVRMEIFFILVLWIPNTNHSGQVEPSDNKNSSVNLLLLVGSK